jgi:hypothetical protein
MSILFPRISIHSSTTIENTDTVDNILVIKSDTIHYSYGRKFLPISRVFSMKGKQWKHISDDKFRMKHNHAAE